MFNTATVPQLQLFSQYLREAEGKGFTPFREAFYNSGILSQRCAFGCIFPVDNPREIGDWEPHAFLRIKLGFPIATDTAIPGWEERAELLHTNWNTFFWEVVNIFDKPIEHDLGNGHLFHTFKSMADLVDEEIAAREAAHNSGGLNCDFERTRAI